MKARRLCLAAMTALLAATAALPARADLIVTGSGSNAETTDSVSASALFRIVGNSLTIALTNTSAPTPIRGDVLQGISFNISGSSPTLALSTIALTSPGSGTADDRIFTSKTASNTSDPLSGSYTNVLGTTPIGQYGVSSTGFNGAFDVGSITRGSGGTDYGIVAAGTFPNSGASNSFNSAFPLIQHSLSFTLTGLSGVSESQITGVKFLFGTSGQGVLNGTVGPAAVPQPASAVLLGLGGLSTLGLAALRRRRASKVA